jgi:hypothetical protein
MAFFISEEGPVVRAMAPFERRDAKNRNPIRLR